MTVWYHVRDLDQGRRFYATKLGFAEVALDPNGQWAELERGSTRIGLAAGEPGEAGVAMVDVDDLKSEAERLRDEQVEVGVVFELRDEIRLLDVFDPDGNRIQLAEELSRG